MSIRDATAGDLPAVVALYADDELGAGREQPGEQLAGEYLRAFAAISADPRTLLVVADDGGEVFGTLQLTFLPHLVRLGGERAQVEAVRVASSRRGSGLGRELLGWAVRTGPRARLRAGAAHHRRDPAGRAPVLRAARLHRGPRRHETVVVTSSRCRS